MKKFFTLGLLPIMIILILLKKMWEVIEPLAMSIGNGIENIIEVNYEFWKKILKWED